MITEHLYDFGSCEGRLEIDDQEFFVVLTVAWSEVSHPALSDPEVEAWLKGPLQKLEGDLRPIYFMGGRGEHLDVNETAEVTIKEGRLVLLPPSESLRKIQVEAQRFMSQEGHGEAQKFALNKGPDEYFEWLRSRWLPRCYEVPGTHYPPRLFASCMTGFFQETVEQKIKPEHPNFKAFATLFNAITVLDAALIRCGVPTLFVGKDFLEAVLHTDLPEEFCPQELNWPFPGMLFVLPRNYVATGLSDCPYLGIIAVGRATEMERRDPSVALNPKGAKDGRLPKYFEESWASLGCMTSVKDSGEYMLGSSGFLTQSLKSFRPLITSLEPNLSSEELEAVTWQIRTLGFKLLFVLSSLRPGQHQTPSVLVKPERSRRGKVQKAWWSPHFLGKSWTRKTERAAKPADDKKEGHASPRMHWRRGHLRHQRFGPGRAFSKVIWIQPVLVAADDPEQPKA